MAYKQIFDIAIRMGFHDHGHFCEKGAAHEGKEVIMICLNPECQNKRLCCLVCIDELHRKHELISLYKFDEMLSVLVKKGDNDMKSGVLSLLNEFEGQVLKQLDGALERFVKYIDKSKEKLRSVINFARESVNLTFTADDIEKVYQNLDNSIVCKYLDLIKEAEGEALKDIQSATKTLTNSHTFLDKILLETQKMYIKGMQDIDTALTKLKKLLGSEGKLSKTLLFSKVDKSVCLNVSEDQKTVKRFQGTGSYPIALFEEPLTEFNNQFTVTLSEQPGNKGCWLGVCVKDIVKNLNFGSCYGIGKGTWAIDQVGASHQSAYSWNHHDASFNSQPKVGFQFMTGDTLTVRVNFDKSTVTFEKGDKSYEMPIQLKIGDIYGFVGCTYNGDIWLIP